MTDREKVIDAMTDAAVMVIHRTPNGTGALELGRVAARAALAALLPLLREPTEAMIEAGLPFVGGDIVFESLGARCLWRAMWAEREKELMG